MAYEGEITYMDIPFGGVEWSNTVHFSGEHVLRAPVRAFSHCKVELEGPQRAILDENRLSENPQFRGSILRALE
jgi:hypothetical protein